MSPKSETSQAITDPACPTDNVIIERRIEGGMTTKTNATHFIFSCERTFATD
jgi:hypothetical protein